MSGQRVVIWFRNDLRLVDNAVVHQAAQLVQKKQASEVSIEGVVLLLPCCCTDSLTDKQCTISISLLNLRL